MLVCHCNGISDRTIRKVVRRGANTAREVAHACGAGACCGGCADAVREIIHAESTASERDAASPTLTAAPGHTALPTS
jgi:bacterioferritin-associated ferredoxin